MSKLDLLRSYQELMMVKLTMADKVILSHGYYWGFFCNKAKDYGMLHEYSTLCDYT